MEKTKKCQCGGTMILLNSNIKEYPDGMFEKSVYWCKKCFLICRYKVPVVKKKKG